MEGLRWWSGAMVALACVFVGLGNGGIDLGIGILTSDMMQMIAESRVPLRPMTMTAKVVQDLVLLNSLVDLGVRCARDEDLRWVPPRQEASKSDMMLECSELASDFEAASDRVRTVMVMEEDAAIALKVSNTMTFLCDSWLDFICWWPWLCYNIDLMLKATSGKIKDDLQWVPPWSGQHSVDLYNLIWIPCGVGICPDGIGNCECSPLVLAMHRESLHSEQKGVVLVDSFKLGKALSSGGFMWLPSIHSAAMWMVHAALKGSARKSGLLNPLPLLN